MFDNLEVLDRARHAALRYRPAAGYGFARAVMAAPLVLSEVVAAGRDYPLVFTEGDEVVPLALLAVRQNAMPFIDDAGRWRGGYIPAHIRRYPFMLQRMAGSGDRRLMIDRDAPQLTDHGPGGEPLFVDGAAPEDGVVARAKAFLARYEQEMTSTRQLLQPLADAGVLVSRSFDVRERGGERRVVDGFRVVDTDVLGRLDAPTSGAWLRSGLLGQVFSHLHSLHALERL